jgi:hypothetical protein
MIDWLRAAENEYIMFFSYLDRREATICGSGKLAESMACSWAKYEGEAAKV